MRRLTIGLGLGVALIIGLHGFAWYQACDLLAAGLDDWVASRAAEGWTIRHGPAARAGWPSRADLLVSDVVVTRAGSTDGLAWTCPTVRLRVALLAPHSIVVSPIGAQRVAHGDEAVATWTAGTFDWTAPLTTAAAPMSARLDATAIQAVVPKLGAPGGVLTIGHLAGLALPVLADGKPPIVQIAARATDIGLPSPRPGQDWPLPGDIANLSVESSLSGTIPSAPTAQAAAAWRDSGGKVDLRLLALDWDTLSATGTATIALDADLQPSVDATLRVSGFDAALTQLASRHVLTQGAARSARAILGLMASAPVDGGPAEVEIPIAVRDRTLSMGRIPLARMAPMPWPDRP